MPAIVRRLSFGVEMDLSGLDYGGKGRRSLALNRFMHLSPTRADHVDPGLAGKVAMILDGGPCRIGVESTVIDVTSHPPRILRPGGVSRGEIQAALGRPLGQMAPTGLRRSPGLYARHYAPKGEVKLVAAVKPKQAGLVFGDAQNDKQIRMPDNPGAYAASMYDAMHRLDSVGCSPIYIQLPPEEPAWETVHDRLRRATGNG